MTEPRIPSTDETVPALDLTDSLPTGPTQSHRGGRRLVVTAAAVAFAAGIAGAVVLGGGSSSDTPAAADSARPAVVAGVGPSTTTVAGDAADSQVQPGAGPQVDPQPEPQPEPPAEPGILAVSTHAIHLADGVLHGSFSVRNDGGSPVDWHWLAGDYGIAVSAEDGTLAPGEHVEVTFTINPFQVPEGDFLFANCIFNDDAALDVWIDGYRKAIVVNPDIPQGPQVLKP